MIGKKMKRALDFLKITIDDPIVIGSKIIRDLFVCIDAAYSVHDDMSNKTGGVMSMVTGVIHARSLKQKLITKSSTESELVGVSEYIPYNLWVDFYLNIKDMK